MEDQCNINLCILAHVAFLKSNNIQITEQVKDRIKKRFVGIKDGSLSSIGSGKNPIEALTLIFTDYQNTINIPKKKRTPFKKPKTTLTTTTITDVSASSPKDEASMVVEELNPTPPAMPERLRGCEITNEENHSDDKYYNYMIARKKRKREIKKRRAREVERRLDVPSSSSPRHDNDNDSDSDDEYNNHNDTNIAEKKKKRRRVRRVDEGERKFEPPPEMPEWLRRMIADVYGGSGEIRLIIQKKLQKSDLKKDQNRLSMPKNQLRHKVAEFLNDEEMNDVCRRDEKCKIVGVQSTVIGMGSAVIVDFKRWDLSISSSFILTRKWYDFATRNKLMIGQVIQVWFFRDGHGNPCFAIVNLDAENNQNPDPTTIASTSTANK